MLQDELLAQGSGAAAGARSDHVGLDERGGAAVAAAAAAVAPTASSSEAAPSVRDPVFWADADRQSELCQHL